MVGSDVYDDGDERALPVRLGDDPVGEQTARRLVLPDRRVPAESIGERMTMTIHLVSKF